MSQGAQPVGVFCPTFLKPEMWHVYRQVVKPSRVRVHVFAFKRENPGRFPCDDVDLLPRSSLRWARRIWYQQILHSPQMALPEECAAFHRALKARAVRLLHIYFGNNGVFWLPLLHRRNIPAIVSFHGADVAVGFNTATGEKRLRELFAIADLLLARSSSLREALISAGCDRDKIRIQRTGIPISEFAYRVRPCPADGCFQVLQACRLIEKKGLEVTLNAFARLLSKRPSSRLVFAGDGPLRGRLEQRAGELGIGNRVTFTGFVGKDQLLEKYYESHLFIHPSETTPSGDTEGIPNSLLEAMATGLCPIATDHSGIPEVIRHLENGVLVKEHDTDAVYHWMDRLTEDWGRAQELGRRAAETINRDFDLAAQIRNLESIYLELIARSTRSGGHGD
jgi:colanic acid/amylovoran biosynthesis glycosyltransferase